MRTPTSKHWLMVDVHGTRSVVLSEDCPSGGILLERPFDERFEDVCHKTGKITARPDDLARHELAHKLDAMSRIEFFEYIQESLKETTK